MSWKYHARTFSCLLWLYACSDYSVPKDTSGTFESCCDGLGTCVSRGLVDPDQLRSLDRDACDTDLVCIPSELIETGSRTLPTCTVELTGAEGRCVPVCLPEVAERPGLRRDDCSSGKLCAPCYDPLNGHATAVCKLGADSGPMRPPVVFGPCCGELGRCVPSALVDEEDRTHLGRDSCASGGDLCVPEPLARDDLAALVRCNVNETDSEGRCVPGCLPDVTERAHHLERTEACAEGEVCAPCYDPVDGQATGACELGGDSGPEQPPFVFPHCCQGLGRCVSGSFVPEKDRERLSREDCEAEDELCAPEGLVVADDYVADSCTLSDTGAEGRCLPACLPEVAGQGMTLTRESCAEGEVCGPCFDPRDGRNTGACNLGADPGPERAPTLFPDCCGGLGRCVPERFVGEAQRARLDRGDCEQAQELCLPEALLLNPDHVFAACNESALAAEGRCLPACLPDVAVRAEQLRQDGCASGELCTPCYDPVDGELTQACGLGGDSGPTRPASTFSGCCGALGRCVPQQRVPERDRERLGRDSCTNEGTLCVPTALARDADYAFASCAVSTTGAEGRCLPACLPGVAARSDQLRPDGCGEGALCTPCYEPVDGADTGACTLGGDTGAQGPAVLFQSCCGDASRCVPRDLIASTDAAHLSQDSCARAQDRCVPSALARDSAALFSTCYDSLTSAEGRCLLACLPEVDARAAQLSAGGCASGELCAPCYDPLDGAATGACDLGGDPGPEAPAFTYPHCCNDAGRCIARARVPQEQLQHVNGDGCSGADDQLCVPLSLAQHPDAAPPGCHDDTTGAEGRCLMRCLPEVQARADQLRQSSCGTDELCVPCFDPVTAEDTGACRLSGSDAPTEPAVVFGDCCGSQGRCVPGSLVSSGDVQILSRQDCANAGWVCAPRVMVEGESARLPSCESPLGYSACVNECFVPAALGDLIPAGGCSDPDRCVPCYVAPGLCP